MDGKRLDGQQILYDVVQLVQDGQEVHDSVKLDSLIDNSNDLESEVVKLSDAQK